MQQNRPAGRRRRAVGGAVVAATLVAGAAAVIVGGPPAALAATPTVDGLAAGNAAIASVDLAGSWSFTPEGRAATTITVPGGGWYKQGFTDVSHAAYSRTVTVPDTGQPQSAWIEFGAVNHQATLSVDGRVVATQTTAFTPSAFDITAFAAPGSTHTITVDVKGRNALKNPANGKYLVPDAAEWSEAVPQGIYRSAFVRVYPAVYISDAVIRTSVANQNLAYDVTVTNTSANARTVTLTGALSSDGGGTFAYPGLPSRTVSVAAHSTAKVTVGPVAWNLGAGSYWWPNVPYRSGYRAQLHRLAVHATTDDGRVSDAAYRFGFRESTQNGEYYYLNGVRVNYRGDNLQGADYDRINNGGVGDAYDTLPGFLPPSAGNGGWPQAVDNYQRLNYNVVRIHQEPASPYMLDVADEMGLMLVDETAIRGSAGQQDYVAGHDNMVNHARALTLRDRSHPAITRWSQSNEPGCCGGPDSQQFEQDLYAAMNGNDGTRPIIVDGMSPTQYPGMTYANFASFPHYNGGLGAYNDSVTATAGRPDGETEYIWPKCSTKQGFEWFATLTAAKRAKDASDLRPYTLLSGWASFVPGVKTTDFVPEEGGRPVYGADNLPDPWNNPQIQRIQAAFHPLAAIDLPYWSASGMSDANGTFPLPSAVGSYAYNTPVTRTITVFDDDFTGTSVGLSWTARLDRPDGTVVASGSTTLTIPLGSRATQPISFTTPGSGSRIYLTLSTTKNAATAFTDAVEYFTLGANSPTNIDDTDARVTYSSGWSHASGEAGPYNGTNSYTDVAGSTATLQFTGTGVTLHTVTDPSHGIVGVSIDGGSETLVDEYSTARTGDVAVWTSPRLTAGQHTIRVRATGNQRSGATHNWATVDRFEISTSTAGGVISLRAHANNQYVTADNGGSSPLIANRATIGTWEQFDLIDAGNGFIALRAHANNQYVTAENAGAAPLIANRTAIGGWEQFQLIRNGDGSVSLKANANGNYVTADNGGSSPLIANRTAIGPWEEFDLITS